MIDIQTKIESMSLEEIKQRLAEYMAADKELMPGLVAVEVRLSQPGTARSEEHTSELQSQR